MTALMLGVSSYLLYLRTGHTPWSLLGIHSWSDAGNRVSPTLDIDQMALKVSQSLQAAGATAKAQAENLLPDGVKPGAEATQVYRWVDAQGVTHFGEVPPEDVSATAVTLAPNRNVIQGVPSEVVESEAEQPVQDTQALMEQLKAQRSDALSGAGE
ncbi:DUF4124 domain-containing protein [Simiduia sp. 21SJ11W-1]|uniref:DUF4124 domain-containing protein n=1 Tax=Simiduia sp. 21SJ11W-1 TaxID=2909669 RepID=UPI00209E0299|nr:DUF4124 domain-containing protein [Simiduia sp. 21SJ11W-1]UTA48914.1 DUF4124 domain-containing protein [Simiduia sp. 21SJ11W-1]